MEKLLEVAGFKILEIRPKREVENYIYNAMIHNKMKLAKEISDRHHWVQCVIKAEKLY